MIPWLSLATIAALLGSGQADRRVSLVCGVRDGTYDAASDAVTPIKGARLKVVAVAFNRGTTGRIDPSTIVITDRDEVLRRGVPTEMLFNPDMTFGLFVEGSGAERTAILGKPNPETKLFRVSVIGAGLTPSDKGLYALAGTCGLVPIEGEKALITSFSQRSGTPQ